MGERPAACWTIIVSLAPGIAAWGIVLAALTNTLVKCGLLLVLAGPSLRARALVATGVILASGIASMLLF